MPVCESPAGIVARGGQGASKEPRWLKLEHLHLQVGPAGAKNSNLKTEMLGQQGSGDNVYISKDPQLQSLYCPEHGSRTTPLSIECRILL